MGKELVKKFFLRKEGRPIYMSHISYAVLSLVVTAMFWTFSLRKWTLWGIYIPDIDLAINDSAVFFICFFVCEVLSLFGAATSVIVSTVTNAFVSVGIPILLLFALFNAEQDFGLMCIIVVISFLFPTVWAVQQYLLSPRELYDRIYLYLCARIGVAILLLIGVFPFTVRNLFSEILSGTQQVQFSAEVVADRDGDKQSLYYLNDLEQMWSDYSSEERFFALKELLGYECKRLGISSVRMETQKQEMGSLRSISSYDSKNSCIKVDIIRLKKDSFSDVLPDFLKTCRIKYQQDLMECMEKLEKAGKNIRAMPDFAWGYQLLEMERLDQEGKMGWETHYDITNADVERWKKKEMKHLKKAFGWNL